MLGPSASLRHEGLHYRGTPDLIEQLASFAADGLAHAEPVLILERPEVIDGLKEIVRDEHGQITYIDITDVGRNPGRIISVWHDFVDKHPGATVRGVGEPLWPGRTEAEAVECHLHESLLNRVFADESAWILCPYDADALDPEHLERMHGTHPVVTSDGAGSIVEGFDAAANLSAALADPLPEPDCPAPTVAFEAGDLGALRWMVERHSAAHGLGAERSSDVAIVVSELITNSLRHGGGRGSLRSWTDNDRVVHEVHDSGHIADPAAGRRLPGANRRTGRGLWIVNHLCDLVRMRSSAEGTTVRVELGPLPAC